ncbi:MAG: radical SAM protein [Selenomonadaceae bacterium]
MIKDILLKIIPNSILNQYYARRTEKKRAREKLTFEVHLVEHCNLNCKGCDNFSSIAEQSFLDIETFEKDIVQLAKLFAGQAERILLLGGEPLLHPEAYRFGAIARKYFPDAEIKIVTNGLLLMQQKDEFWKSCKENNIIISSTKYPIKIDYEKIEEYMKSKDVVFEFGDNTGIIEKTLHCWPIDIDGKQDPRISFEVCQRANNCISLKQGKMFTCTVIPNICHFNSFFGSALQVSDADSIDIYKAKSAQEILDFFARPVPFCKYCDTLHVKNNIKWDISKKDINEWT